MSMMQMIIWFVSFFTLYAAVNLYLLVRLRQSLGGYPRLRRVATVLFLISSLSYWIARVIEKISVCVASDLLFIAGSFWFGAMLYFFLALIVIDLVRLLNRPFPFLPRILMERRDRVKPFILAVVIGIAGIALTAGYFLARSPVITELSLSVDRKKGKEGTVVMALVTDIHMGTIVRNAHLERMVEMIREIGPDLVLLGGDMVDEDMEPVIRYDLGDILRKITTRYPTYAVTGNHEYYGGIDEAVGYLEEHGVVMLRDRWVKIGGIFTLAGRDDRTKNDFSREKRKSLREVAAGADRGLPLVVMDHNPSGIVEAAGEGVDLVLSGHTHQGQLWPMNYLTSRIFPVDGGGGKVKETQIYVSRGFGTWGPPVRIGSRPEVVKLTVTFR